MRPPVIRAGYSLEPLLARGIPNLQLALIMVHFQSSELEVHPDGGGVVFEVRVVAESEEDCRLPHSLAAHNDNLEEIVVLFDHISPQICTIEYKLIRNEMGSYNMSAFGISIINIVR